MKKLTDRQIAQLYFDISCDFKKLIDSDTSPTEEKFNQIYQILLCNLNSALNGCYSSLFSLAEAEKQKNIYHF